MSTYDDELEKLGRALLIQSNNMLDNAVDRQLGKHLVACLQTENAALKEENERLKLNDELVEPLQIDNEWLKQYNETLLEEKRSVRLENDSLKARVAELEHRLEACQQTKSPVHLYGGTTP